MKKFILLLLLFPTVAFSAEDTVLPLNLSDINNNPATAGGGTAPLMDAEDLNFDQSVDAFGEPVLLDSKSAVPFNAPASSRQSSQEDTFKVDTRQSLTDNIRENAPESIQNDQSASNGTNWVGQLISTAKENIQSSSSEKNPLADMLEQSQAQKRRSNASVFDISGVMLRMSYKQAEDALTKRGYKKTMQKMDIPNFIRWRNEEKCRNQGVIGYERLENCVIRLASKENYQFISQAQFSKYDTKETVQIYLTSTFTNNKIYKITYRSEAANVTGNSPKALYLRNIKVYDFWKKINQKYGVPDNKDDVIWGLGGNKPYMRAATGFLLLEDNMLRELDYTRMSREDQRFMNTDLYTF